MDQKGREGHLKKANCFAFLRAQALEEDRSLRRSRVRSDGGRGAPSGPPRKIATLTCGAARRIRQPRKGLFLLLWDMWYDECVYRYIYR